MLLPFTPKFLRYLVPKRCHADGPKFHRNIPFTWIIIDFLTRIKVVVRQGPKPLWFAEISADTPKLWTMDISLVQVGHFHHLMYSSWVSLKFENLCVTCVGYTFMVASITYVMCRLDHMILWRMLLWNLCKTRFPQFLLFSLLHRMDHFRSCYIWLP